MDDLRLAAAAFFRNKGKNVITENEFLMDVSMSLRWMPYGAAEGLLGNLIKSGIVEKDGEYIKPKFDVSKVDVPMGYKPPASLATAKKKTDEVDLFQTLLAKAAEAGIDKKDFMAGCRRLQKSMNVEIEVAAVILLRDSGVSVNAYIDETYTAISKR